MSSEDRARFGERLWQRVVLALAAGIGTLLLLEALSWLGGRLDGPLQPLQVGSLQLYGRHDPLLFWSLDPGTHGEHGRRWINDDGLRGPELGDKEATEYRILSLGESTTFAAQMPYERSYSAQLEGLLDEADPTRRVRVMNGGVPGYSLFQGVLYLGHRAKRLEPDMVLFYFGYNDFLPVAYLADRATDAGATGAGMNDWELFDHRQKPAQRVLSWLTTWSNLFRGLSGMVATTGGSGLSRNVERPRVPPSHRIRLLEMAAAYAHENGIQLVIVVPVYASFDGHAPLLRTFAADNDIPIVDLPELLGTTFGPQRDSYFLDPIHPSPRGHRRIAQAIRDEIEPLVSARARP